MKIPSEDFQAECTRHGTIRMAPAMLAGDIQCREKNWSVLNTRALV